MSTVVVLPVSAMVFDEHPKSAEALTIPSPVAAAKRVKSLRVSVVSMIPSFVVDDGEIVASSACSVIPLGRVNEIYPTFRYACGCV